MSENPGNWIPILQQLVAQNLPAKRAYSGRRVPWCKKWEMPQYEVA
jgi:hypothetical protein